MLIQHGVDNVDERLVAAEESVSTGQEVSLEPSLALVLREHLEDPPIRRQMIVARCDLGLPGAVGYRKDILEPVGGGLVGAENPEIGGIRRDDVA
jgi:hypothetical protein